MIKLLQRDSFFAPEIEIFKSAAKWCKTNNDIDDLVVQCVRLSWLTVVEIVSIVWPSKLVNSENLLQAIAEIVEVKPKLSCCRAKLRKNCFLLAITV
jgi:BTB/POZ domain-containing protein 9